MNKKNLRKFNKYIRDSVPLSVKIESDKRIFTRLINSRIFFDSDLILIYVSTDSEVDTVSIIDYALKIGKRVAVPYCDKKNSMSFYEIESLSQLKEGKFGILTVNPDNNILVTDYVGALCIVPALCFDRFGNRIGYGGGYYDRFLSAEDVYSLGLCYEINFSTDCLPSESFDVAVNSVLTENKLMTFKCEEVNTYE